MKKIYFTFFLLLLCTVSVFSSQLCNKVISAKRVKTVAPSPKDSANIISGIIALPSFR